MFEFLAREEDKKIFSEMLSLIRDNKCVAFVGSGMSKTLGYRMWEEGIRGENQSSPTLVELAKIPLEQAKKEPSLPKLVDDCKEILGGKYYDYIKKEFGGNHKSNHHLSLRFLWDANFQHVITTNFDSSLWENSCYCEKLITYPSEKLKIQDERTLYHLHGRAYKTSKEKGDVLNYYLEKMIYGRQSYLNAYDSKLGNKAVENFLYNIMQDFTLVFIGFSMKDEDFKTTYINMKLGLEKYISLIEEHPWKTRKNLNKNYILLPYPEKSDHKIEESYDKEKKQFDYDELDLLKNNIIVIAYKKKLLGNEFVGLTETLQHIMEEAPYKFKSKPLEFGDFNLDSDSASEVTR